MRTNFLSKSYQSIALFLRARGEVGSDNDVPELHELEQRVFYDASPLGVVLDDFVDSPENVEVDDANFVEHVEEAVSEDFSYAPEWAHSETRINEVVFIDGDVDDYSLLIHDLADQSDVAVFLLDPNSDGVQQITDALKNYSQLSAIHIVSHGDEGFFEVGGSTVSLESLDSYATQISQWGNHLSADADLLIYGCNVAGSEDGRGLIDTMESLTGADIAASEDLTGSAQLGGNWSFEYAVGSVEATAVFSSSIAQNWSSTLDVTGYPTSNGSDNSFEHIANVTFAGINNSTGADVGGYADYSAQIANITIGQSNTLSVTISPDPPNYIMAWIDWNQDKDFLDAGEEYVVAAGVSGAGPYSIDIVAPIDAVAGNTIMRVSMSYSAPPPSFGTFTYGEVEDYTVAVTDPFQNTDVDENSLDGTQVIQPHSFSPEVTVANVLAADSSLSYDATTNKFYKLITSGTTWSNAQIIANSDQINGISGQLVNIRSAYENSLIQTMILPFGSEYYIGGTDATVEGQWNWYDDGAESDRFWNGAAGGSAPGGAYANFHVAEPQGGALENYAVIRASDAVWIDVDGTGNRGYIVEWDASDVINRYTYTLTDDAGGRFAIDNLTGEITVADGTLLDYETNTSHNITVEVDDVSGATDVVNGLQGHYRFEGDATDSSLGASYDGTFSGDAHVQDDSERGQVLNLDGVGDYVDISPHVSSIGSHTEGTITSWVKTSGSSEQTIFTLSDSADPDSDATLFVRSDGLVQFQVVEGGGAGTLVFYSSISVNDGQWHHIAVTVDSGGPHLYIDGLEDTSLSYMAGNAATRGFFSDINTPDAMAVGTRINNGGTGWSFQGQLDDTRVYSRALSAAEVSEIVYEKPTAVQSYSIAVNPVNEPAVAVDDNAVTSENVPVVIDVISNDVDPDSSPIYVLDVLNPSNGTVVNNGDGTVTYTPDTNYSGADSFDYVVSDTEGTASYWSFDGDATDGVGSNDGTIVGATTVEGEKGDALSFDEVDDHVVLNDFSITDAYTLSFQIKVDDNSGSLFQYLFSYGDVNATNSLNIFLNEASHGTDPNMLRTVVRDSNDTLDNLALQFDASSIIGDGQWHTYTLTVESGVGSKVYLDGVLMTSDSRGGDAWDPATDIYLGARQDLDANRRYGGELDTLQIFDRALTASEVNDEYTGSNSVGTVNVTIGAVNQTPVVDGPVASYSVNEQAVLSIEGTGFTVSDADAGSGTMTATIAVGEGLVNVSPGDSGVTITGGNGTGTVTFSGTLAQIDSLLTAVGTGTIQYVNNNDAPSASTSITVTVNDGGNTGADPGTTADATSEEDFATQTITLVGINDAPVLTDLDGDLVGAANDGVSVILDTGSLATLTDVDNPADLNGGSLQLSGVGFDVLDQLAIDTSGSIALSAGMTNGSIVSVGGTAIGTLASVSSSGFVLNFNSDSTLSRVESVIQATEFSSTSTVFGSRTVDYTLVDGDGVALGGSDTETATVTVNLFSASNGSVSTSEDTNYTFASSDFGFTGITGTDFRDITVTTLPVNGLLKLNGTNVIVGQTIDKADIDANLLTFEPVADANGTPYASFDFYVNEGNQTLTILAGLNSSYTVGGALLVPTTDLVTNNSNFGPSGTFPVDLLIGPATSTVDASYLSQGQILFDGYVPDANWTAGDLSALDAWVSSGGVLISTNDDASYDPVASYFGLTIGGTASSIWNIANNTHEIMNGDFGLVGNIGDPFTAAGSISYFNSASLIGGDVVLATDSVSGEPTMVLRQYGSGWILFTSDEGPFRAGMTGGGTVSTANDILVGNVFAWASNSAAPQEFQIDIQVSAVNDDPTNAGSLPSDVSVTEDVATNVDLSSVDFNDVDSGSGTLTVTLSTSTGGQLTGSAGTGITIGGTAAARTFTGTLTDLNNYFDNASSISYVHGTPNTNGDNADTITVVINDNGNTGSGGGTDQNLGTVNVDVTAVNDDPTNVGGLPTDVAVTEDVSSGIDLSAVNFSDVDAASSALTVTLSTSTGGQLTGAAGTGITIGGTASARTFTGTLVDLNNYFNNTSSISYVHGTPNTNGDNADTITVVINDNGNTGTGGGTDQNLGTVNVDITAVNDDPTNAGSLPSDVAVTEDVATNVDLSAVDFSDVDAASGTLTVTLSTSTGGQLTGSAGTGITIGGTAAARTFTGTLTDLNNYFDNASSISYVHGTPHTNGDNADTITVVINDNGNTGTGGGTDQNLGSLNVDITAVNDDPTNAGTLPSDVAVTEDVATSVDLSAVDFSDVDAASGALTVTLSTSTGGQLTGSAGTGITIGGTAAARTFTGTLVDLNNYFNNASSFSYVHGTPHTNGDNADTITVVINDNGNTGTGGGTDQNLGTVNVDITAVNDSPILTREAEVDFEGYTTGDLGGQNGWTTESFNTSGELQVTSGAGVDGSTAITFGLVGSGVGSSGSLVGESALPDLNNASSATIEWSSRNSFWGTRFGIAADENGDGQILAASDEVALSVHVKSVDSTIQVTLPDASTINYVHSFSGGDWIEFRWEIDLTANAGQGEGTLYFRNATLGETNWQTDPALSSINLGLDTGASDKTNAANWDGIQIHAEGGTGGFDNIHVTVDSPSGSVAFVEGGAPVVLDGNVEVFDQELSTLDDLNGATLTLLRSGVANADDVYSATGTLSLLSEGGSLVVDGISIGTVTTNSAGSLLLTFNGNATNALVNSAMQQIAYQNVSDTPPASVQIDWTFDDGNGVGQGTGGALTAFGSTQVMITAVNDDPTNAGSLPSDVSVTEDVLTNVDLSAVDFSDVDAASGTLTVTLSTSTGGQLTGAAGTGITIGGTATARTLTGTLADLNNYFNNTSSISYVHGTPNTNGDNADAITVVINDNGNTGTGGGTDQNLGTVNVDITAVNDDPTNAGSLPSDVSVTEDVLTNVDLSSVDFSDVDSASGTLTVTLSTSTGGQLTGAAGTGITIGGTAAARTFTGTLVDLNNYFNNASSIGYVHGTPNTNGDNADTITVVINDNGNTGSGGGTDQNLGTINVDITAVNDDPTNAGTLPSDVAVTEDVSTNVDLSAVDFSDVDAASSTLTVTLSTSTGGQLTGAVGTGITIGGTAAARTFTGTLADLNNYFNNTSSISYVHGTPNTNGDNADTITVVINDNGNTGSGGGTDQNLGTVNVDIAAVNDDPTNAGTLPTDVTVTEDVSTNVDLSAVDFSDVDASSGTLTVTLSTSTGGQLTGAAGTGITIGGTAAARTFTGTLVDLNNYFNNTSSISYVHGTPNTNGDNADTITVVINDNGNTGSGGGTDQNLGTINVDITAVNDDPTNAGTLPSDVSVTEDVLTNVDLSSVDFSDVDSASGTLTVTLSTSTGGQLTGSAGTGITIGGTAAARTFTGTLADLNNYFNNTSSLSYLHGTPNTNGDNADTITVVINDNGNTGSGGGTDQNLGTVNVDITAVNDDPTNAGSLPSDVAVTEDVATNVDLSAIDFSDVDAVSGTLTVALSTSTGGQLTGSAGTGITIGGTAAARTFTGTLADLNNYFNNTSSISYVHGTPNTNGDNADTITVVINDNGNTGTGGGTDQNLGTVNVDITAVNDDPTNAGTLPSDVAVTEDVSTNVDLSAVDFSDVDSASGALTVTLSTSTGGQLTGSAGTGITIGGTAAARTFTGTLVDLNNYFNNTSSISYVHGTPHTNGDNADTITVVINDNGNTGTGGGTDQNLGTVNVDITAVNDDPTNAGTLPSDVAVTEDVATNVDLSAVDFSDVDAASSTLTVTLSTSTGGQLTGSAGTGITIGGTAAARTFTGTLVDLNNYFNNTSNISYLHGTPNTNGDNADTITVVINDNGNTGAGGGTDQNLGTVNVDITSVNDAPTTDDVIASGSEGAASIPVTLTGSDLDGTVQWFSLSNLPANGTLYLDAGLTNPVAIATDIAASGEALTLYFVPDAFWNGSTNFQYSAKDDLGLSDSTPATATINVSAVNDAPVTSTIEGTPVDYDENDGAVQITNTISISDVDDTDIESATIQITGNYTTGQDVLAFTNTANISGVWNSVTGTLVLSGTDTLANYELALQSITFENTSENPSGTTRTVSFTVNDGNLDSNTLTRDIDVNPINDAPVESSIEGSTINYTENDGAAQITNAISIADVDDMDIESASIQITGNYVSGEDVLAFTNTLNITGTWDALTGTLTLTGTDTLANYEAALRAITYENVSENPSGLQRTVSFTVNDGDNNSNVVSRDIDVIPVNDNPVAVADSVGVNEGGTVNIAAPGLLGNDTDSENDPLTATLLTGPTNGVVVVNADGSYQYTHDGSETTSDSFTYQVSDGAGGFDSATVNITVTPVNDVPVATGDSYSVNEAGILSPLSGVLANDVDADGDPLTASVVSGPANGALTLNSDGTFVYSHDGSETTFDSFTYQVADGNGGFDTAIVNLTINPVNDVPVALDDSYSLNEGSVLTVNSAAGVQSNDFDSEGDLLTATLVSGPSNGTVTLNANGSFVYTHDGSETTTDQFVYQVDDGNGGVDSAVVMLTITPVNDAPVANSDSYSIAEEALLLNDVSTNDSDAEGDTLTYSLISGPNFAQSFTLNADGTFSYLPNIDYFGLDSFTYQADDGNGGVSSVDVFINVTNVNDAPNSAPESYLAISGELLDIIVGVLDNDHDVDGDALIATLLVAPSNGTITFHPDGTFQYVSDQGYAGTDSFFYLANDGTTSGTAIEVTITVEPGGVIDPGGGDDGDSDSEDGEETPPTIPELTPEDDSQEDDKLTEGLGQIVNNNSGTEFIGNEVAQFKIVELEEIADVNVASRALLQLVEYSSRSDSSEYIVDSRSASSIGDLSVVFDAQVLWDQMDNFAKEVLDTNHNVNVDFTLSSITSMATLGGILWVLRGGVLMATTLSQLPTWRMIDPLTVLDSFRTTPTAGEDELGEFFED